MVKSVLYNRWTKQAVVAYVVVAAVLGCGARVDEPHESNTNWLRACDNSAECGADMACECGVCTIVCDTLACPQSLSCLAAGECSSGTVASCQAPCETDVECDILGSGVMCNSGVCEAKTGGLALSQVSKPADSGTNSTSPGPDDVTCRFAYVDYPVGERVCHDGCCDTLSCTCGEDGEWTDCSGDDRVCSWTNVVRPCAEMFPGVDPEHITSDAIAIQSSAVNGTDLTLQVGHSGGCRTHDFVLCFQPGVQAGVVPGYNAPSVELVLIHDAHDDGCEAFIERPLNFDLTPIASDQGSLVQTNYGLVAIGLLSCEQREAASAITLSTVIAEASLACQTDDDCVNANNSTGCHAGCGTTTSTAGAESISTAIAAIDEQYCGDYEAAGCGPVTIPPCDPRGAVKCVAGLCTDE